MEIQVQGLAIVAQHYRNAFLLINKALCAAAKLIQTDHCWVTCTTLVCAIEYGLSEDKALQIAFDRRDANLLDKVLGMGNRISKVQYFENHKWLDSIGREHCCVCPNCKASISWLFHQRARSPSQPNQIRLQCTSCRHIGFYHYDCKIQIPIVNT